MDGIKYPGSKVAADGGCDRAFRATQPCKRWWVTAIQLDLPSPTPLSVADYCCL